MTRTAPNEGDLAIAADFITPHAVNFFAREGCGLICIAMTGEMIDKFALKMMAPPEKNGSRFGTGFTVSVEAKEGVRPASPLMIAPIRCGR